LWVVIDVCGLMMMAPEETERNLNRLAQLARAHWDSRNHRHPTTFGGCDHRRSKPISLRVFLLQWSPALTAAWCSTSPARNA
jgi:hypothetical protein